MTVEQLITSALSDEVAKQLNPATVKEIVTKKTERLTEEILKKTDFEKIVKSYLENWLKSWNGQEFLRSVISESITISLTKKDK